jgi:hypothetical protein
MQSYTTQAAILRKLENAKTTASGNPERGDTFTANERE